MRREGNKSVWKEGKTTVRIVCNITMCKEELTTGKKVNTIGSFIEGHTSLCKEGNTGGFK